MFSETRFAGDDFVPKMHRSSDKWKGLSQSKSVMSCVYLIMRQNSSFLCSWLIE